MMKPTLAFCEALDWNDPLRNFRDEFVLMPRRIYLDGNSLGLLTHTAKERVRAAVEEEWATDAVQGWHVHDWMSLPDRLGARIARLLGAHADEVTVADSTSINIFKLASSCLHVSRKRRKIVTELGNFPTDLYVLQGLADLMSPYVELRALPREKVLDAIDTDTALVVLTRSEEHTSELQSPI